MKHLFPWLLLLLSGTAMADNADLQIADHHIIPSYQQLADKTAALNAASKTFCKTPSEATLQPLRQGFVDSMHAWQDIQHIRFGPIQVLLREHRFQIWPDKRGTVGKHLRKLIAADNPKSLEKDNFAAGSIAVQGFSALERLLYPADAIQATDFGGNEGDFRCQLLSAITSNLALMSNALVSEWQQGDTAYRRYFASAAEGNEIFDNAKELHGKLLNNLHTELQLIVDQKLNRPLGKSAAKARGKKAESWRSGQSLNNIAVNLKANQALFERAFAPALLGTPLLQQITDAYKKTLTALHKIKLPLARAVSEQRDVVLQFRDTASRLKALVGQRLPTALELSLGFNSLDGD